MPPFSGKQKKEQLKARRQRKREESELAREREKAHDDALYAGADPDVLAEAEAAAQAAIPRGRHALRRQRQAGDEKKSTQRRAPHGNERSDSSSDDDDDNDEGGAGEAEYDPAREYKYGADRKGVRSVFQKESPAELAARRAMSYRPLNQRNFITASGVPYGSWFVLAGDEAVMTAAKKRETQRQLEKAARVAAAAAASGAAVASDADEETGPATCNGGEGEDGAATTTTTTTTSSPSPGPASALGLTAHFCATAVSTTFPFSAELPSRGWRLNGETGQMERTYTRPHASSTDPSDTRKADTQEVTKPPQQQYNKDDSDDAHDDDDEETSHSDSSSSSSVCAPEQEGKPVEASPGQTGGTGHDAIDEAERRCFHDYLAVLDHYALPAALEGLQLNSYERNLEVWRQLWRTVEVSDVVMVVTDARYPIIHTPAALLRYITVQCRKPCVVILNKSDLVPANVLQSWMQFLTQLFTRLGLRVVSAVDVAHAAAGSEDSANSVAPIVLVPFTADPRSGQSAIDGITERVDASKRLRKKEKRRAKMYEQLRTGHFQYDEDDEKDEDEDDTYHSSVNFKGMKKAEHNLQQEKRAYSELQVVADAITSMLALCRALVPPEKRGAAHAAAAEATPHAAKASPMTTSHLPSAPRVKPRASHKKKSKKRQLLPHGGVAPPSESDEDAAGGTEDGAQSDAEDVLHDRAPDKDAYVHVGFVGFPNVGKSSLLNCIRGTKVVSVSMTPGHTKHMQTIPIPAEGVTLVDSPGLAFPCFGVPRPLQAIIGTHQIAQTRDPQSGVAYLASYLPIEKIYGLQKPDGAVAEEDWTPYDLCEAYAKKRGFFVKHGKGALDVHRGAIALLQEAYEGRLPFFFAAPELNLLDAKYFTSTVLPLLYLPVLHAQ